MNKKFLISWVVVFVVWMIGSFAVHGAWLGDTYAGMTNMMRPEEEQMGLFHWMLLAHVVMAGAFVWIYQRGVEEKSWVQQSIGDTVLLIVVGLVAAFLNRSPAEAD